jgi:pyruvate/2-oxoglutarate/acetoin dehydrogenase E1 component
VVNEQAMSDSPAFKVLIAGGGCAGASGSRPSTRSAPRWSLRPLDMETVAASVAKTNRVLCVEEGWPTYGVTAEIAARVQQACFDDLDGPVMRVGMAEIPMPYAKNLENATLPHEDKILRAALATLS